jgi:hypothetical protein
VAGERWRCGRARALFDEGDDPGLTERVGALVSEREATAESDKQREGGDGRIGQVARGWRWSNRTSGAGQTGRKEVGHGWARK